MIKPVNFSLLLLLLFTFSAHGQQNDITFLVKTIKDTYAGYQDKTNDEKFEKYVKQTVRAYGSDTFHILTDIANYFHDPHLSVTQPKQQAFTDSSDYKSNFQKVKNYFSNTQLPKDQYEGYWINDHNNCVIALQKKPKRINEYQGIVMECENKVLPSGMVCIKMKKMSDGTYSTDYYGPYTGRRANIKSKFRSNSIFTSGYANKWKKLKTYNQPVLASMPDEIETVTTTVLDDKTFLITIPGNSEENTKAMDSIVKANRHILNNIQTLIIDIRGNLGGAIRTYAPLLPYVYTQPINRIGGWTKCSPTLIEEEEKDLKEFESEKKPDSTRIAKQQEYVGKIKSNIGKMWSDPGGTYKADSIKINPKNVAIIANYACLSAAEMMILDFKQSSKVTLFGETTYGALDYLDVVRLESPSKKYTLSVATSKRQTSKDQPLYDNRGITPDVFISDSNNDWVKFVQTYYSQTK
jgi:hypothetical protein